MKECDICGKELEYGEWQWYKLKDRYGRNMSMLLCEECYQRIKNREEKEE